jgi:asparagine synthase (glutamine-hydrolysing)
MCGIAGIWNFNDRSESNAIVSMVEKLKHRGPDGSGIAEPESGQLYLGHTRLAIIDLTERGKQPFWDSENGNCIVFNGEIYNFLEIRKVLVSYGKSFVSDTDTEVILKAYDQWGQDCVTRFKGIFAFAIYDKKQKKLVLCRDQMGVKPLYFYFRNGILVFASEVRAILASGMVKRELSPEGLFSYLEYGSVQEPWTMIRHVKSLPVGTLAVFDSLSDCNFYRYWELSCGKYQSGLDALDFEKTLVDVFRLQMIADVPVGAFLSGGTDSSAVVAGIRKAGYSIFKTFCICFPEEEYDERMYAAKAAECFATEHHELELTEKYFLDNYARAIADFDQPSVDGLNTWFVAKLVKEAGLKVALSGLGGDEVFGGYNRFAKQRKIFKAYPFLKLLPEFIGRLGERAAPSNFWKKLFACAGFARNPYFLARQIFSLNEIRRFLANDLYSAGVNWFKDSYGAIEKTLFAGDPVNSISYFELNSYLLSTLLRDADQMSMCHALELRVPLLDHVLVEKVLSLPGSFKTDPTLPQKHVLVKAIGDLPEFCYNRPKKGFVLPFEKWLRKQLFKNTVSAAAELKSSFLNSSEIDEQCNRFFAGKTDWIRIWSLLVLDDWIMRNIDT